MLKELTISNFKSFNEAVTFSMEADIKNVSEYKDHIIDVNDNKILKISTMYGPNGGGKSNLLEAIKLPSTMLDRRIFNKNYEFKCLYSDSDIVSETIFYVNDEFELGYSFEFKYDFTSLKDSYYINNREFKEVNLNIISETISFRENGSTEFKELLYRDETGIVETDYFPNYKFSQLGVGLSVLKKAYEDYANNDYNNELSARVIRSLYKEIKNINSLDFIVGAYNYLSNNEFKEKVINNLDYIDIKIADIIYKEETNDVYFVRNINVDGVTKQKLINLEQESKGTQKIFNIIYELLINSHRNILFIADDLNSHLHPKLSEVLIKIFTSSINNKSQLIFNSHDISVMNNVLFRRDEIWLVYRDDNYSSKLITISNIFNTKGERIRKDAKYGKQYLEGRYGADPFIKKGLMWNE